MSSLSVLSTGTKDTLGHLIGHLLFLSSHFSMHFLQNLFWHISHFNGSFNKLEQIGHFGNGSQGLRIYSVKGKGNTLGTGGSNQENYLVTLPNGKQIIRQLSTLELERQQTLPDGYTKLAGIPDRERRKMIGNGWTIDVITHLFKQINS